MATAIGYTHPTDFHFSQYGELNCTAQEDLKDYILADGDRDRFFTRRQVTPWQCLGYVKIR